MSSFMSRLIGKGSSTPAQSAKDRLKFVLVADRTNLSPEDLRKMQNEILEVIRKYCRVKEEDVDLKVEQRDRESYLVADIPLSPPRPGEKGGSIRVETTLITEDDDEAAGEGAAKPEASEKTETDSSPSAFN